MVTNFFTFAASIIVAKAAANFDWTAAKTQLESKRTLWLNTGIKSYAYHWEVDCVCDPCYIGGKYIAINDESVTNVRFDPEWLIDNKYCTSPLSTSDFKDITFYYDKAIEHAQQGIDANCHNMTAFKIGVDPTPNSICGGSVSVQYDDILYYPTSISLRYALDIGESWTFSCLTPISDQTNIDLSLYAKECPECSICTMNVDPYCCEGEVYENSCIALCDGGCTEGGYKTFPDGLDETEISCEGEEACSSCEDSYDPVCCDGKHYNNADCASCDGARGCIALPDDVGDCPCIDADYLQFKNVYKGDISFCNICFCDDENTEICIETIDELPQRQTDIFMEKCYNLECDFDFVGLKDGWSDLNESDVCDCTLSECKEDITDSITYNITDSYDLDSDGNRIGVFIDYLNNNTIIWIIVGAVSCLICCGLTGCIVNRWCCNSYQEFEESEGGHDDNDNENENEPICV